MTNVVEVEHLEKYYGSFVAVEDVGFSVGEGEVFGILGPNGAGKTTTVECLQGLRRIDGGSARVLGLDPTSQAAELRRRIGSQLDAGLSWLVFGLIALVSAGLGVRYFRWE